jgi:hypothetical protein
MYEVMMNTTQHYLQAIRSRTMKKTQPLLIATITFFTILVGTQIAGAQEWNFFTSPNGVTLYSVPETPLHAPSGEKGLSNLRYPKPKDSTQFQTNRNQGQWSQAPTLHAYSSLGSWAPLPGTPGNENFTLFSF